MPSQSRRRFLISVVAGLGGCSAAERESTDTTTSLETTQPPTGSPPTTTQTATETPTEPPTETATPRAVQCGRRWDPDVRWSFETETRAHPPTVADGTVYFASQDGHLYALEAGSGQVHWKRVRDTAWNVAPVIADGVVTYSGYSNAAAYDAATGDELWSFEPSGANATLAYAFDDDGEAVYLGASNHTSPSVVVDDPYDRVYAFDRRSGDRLWTTTLSESSQEYVPPQSVTAAGDKVFVTVGDQQGEILALDATDGSELWRHSIERFVGEPIVANGMVYQNSGTSLLALNATTGRVKWQTDGENSPGISGETVYCSKDGILRAYAATDGRTRWAAEIPDEGCGDRPRAAGDVVYVPSGCYSGYGRLYAFDAAEGCRLGAFEVRSARPTPPAVVDDTVYVGGLNGAARLWAIFAV